MKSSPGKSSLVIIRLETPKDIADIFSVTHAAFKQENEARLVNNLRDAGVLSCSLVAEEEGSILGHLALSPVTIKDEDKTHQGLGLGSISVSPSHQRKGIGQLLIRHWLEHYAKASDNLVILLGHPSYYPRFGFKPSAPFGIRWEIQVPEENFMVLELRPNALDEISGIVSYHPAFNDH